MYAVCPGTPVLPVYYAPSNYCLGTEGNIGFYKLRMMVILGLVRISSLTS